MTTPSRGAWPAGLLGMLALMAAMERYVARHSERFTTLHAAAWRQSGESTDKAAHCRVVALGDSLVKHGLIAPIVADRAGRSVANLAVPKGMFPGHDALLRRLFEAGATLDAIVVDGEMLGEDPFEIARIWPEMLTLAECAEIARIGRNPDFLAAMALARTLPTFKARHEVRLSITTALDGQSPAEPAALPVFKRNWRRNGNAEVFADRDDPPGKDPRPAQIDATNYRPSHWVCHPVNDAFTIRFLDRARDHGVPVFWLMPPYHPEIVARRGQYGQYGKYVDYLKSLVVRYPNLTVVDGRKAGYPASALFDMTHLSRTGAIVYSDAVGGLLRDLLDRPDRPRWVALPRYDAAAASALAAASAVEDVPTSGRELGKVMNEVARQRERRVAQSMNPTQRAVRR